MARHAFLMAAPLALQNITTRMALPPRRKHSFLLMLYGTSPITRFAKHRQWHKWERTAKNLHERLLKERFPRSSLRVARRKMPPWDEICDYADVVWRAVNGEGSKKCMQIWNKTEFPKRADRILRRGPLLLSKQERKYGQCWLAPNAARTTKSPFGAKTNLPVSIRDIMWMCKHESRWFLMRMLKRNFDFRPSKCRKRLEKLKLEISHLCHNPACLNPDHLNLEQHGKWHSLDPVRDQDIRPNEVSYIPGWKRDLKQVTYEETPRPGLPDAFAGAAVSTPGGSKALFRAALPLTEGEKDPDVTVGTGTKSGNVDRTCKGFPAWIDRTGKAATCPCPHTPECLHSITRSLQLRVLATPMDENVMLNLGCVVGEASEEAKRFIFLHDMCEEVDEEPTNRELRF